MLTTIVCVIALRGAHYTQKLTFQFTEAEVDSLALDLGLVHPTPKQLQDAACKHLQLAIEISRGE